MIKPALPIAITLVFVCCLNFFSATVRADEAKPIYASDGQLDIDYYDTLIVTQPKLLIEQLMPLVDKSGTKAELDTQLQARYLISNAYYYLSQRNNIIPIAEKGLALAVQLGNKTYEARFLGILAVGMLSSRNVDKAAEYANRSLLLVEEHSPESTLHGDMALLAAQVYYESGGLQNALKVMVKANDIFTELNDTKNRSEALASIALIYDELGQPEQALDYHFKSLELINIEENLVEASITYYNIALTHRNLEQNEKARNYAELSLEYANRANDEVGAAYAIYELAYLDEAMQQFDRSLELVNQVLPVFEENNIAGMLILNHLLRARLRAKLGLPGWEADLAVAEPLVEKTSTLKRRIALVRTKAKINDWLGNQAEALEHYKTWVKLDEEQLKASQQQSTRRYQAMFELKEAEAENQLLNTQKKLAESELEAREFRQWLLVIMLVSLFIVLAAAVAVLIIQIRTKKKFRELALVDELTRTRNRRSISVFAQKAMATARENGTDISFVMIDIDHFKSFNDRFGHDVGDEVLKKVADTISTELRSRDALGRWGGEEWLMVLPDSRCSNIDNIFKRIQTRLKHMTLNVEGAPTITVSMGGTELHEEDSSLEQVVKRADEALYEAKENGRDRFEIKP